MKQTKKWHLILIFSVLLLTLYNILPTIIYYSKPLNKPIDEKMSASIANEALCRIETLDNEALLWLNSFATNLHIKPESIKEDPQNPSLIEISFKNPKDAKIFKSYMPQAGALIPFAPAKLSLVSSQNEHPCKALIQKKVSCAGKFEELAFEYIVKNDGKKISPIYLERFKQHAQSVATTLLQSDSSQNLLDSLSASKLKTVHQDELKKITHKLNEVASIFGKDSEIFKRYLKLSKGLEDPLKEMEKKLLASTEKKAEPSLKLNDLISQLSATESAASSLKPQLLENLSIDFKDLHPLFSSLKIDLKRDLLELCLHPDLQKIQAKLLRDELTQKQKDLLDKLLVNELAKINEQTALNVQKDPSNIYLSLNEQKEANAFLSLDLSKLALRETLSLQADLKNNWRPRSPEFKDGSFPIWDYKTYQGLSQTDKKFGLLIYAPLLDETTPMRGFKKTSIFIVAKGLTPILQKYQQIHDLKQAEIFKEDFTELQAIFKQHGFEFSYLADELAMPSSVQGNFVFERPNFYKDFLAATRENFQVKGCMKFADLELTTLGERIHTQNKIEREIHDELLKWQDDYNASKVNIQDSQSRFFIPKPFKNVYLSNLKMGLKQYLRGDPKKVLKWGLDLYGGKSILLGLRDQNGNLITEKEALSEAVSELTQRVNKMGLSEVDIRVEGSRIALDFPSAKGLSASELVQGSSMSFHVVHEKFASKNSPHFSLMQEFLQGVWNEALISRKTDTKSLQQIAWNHLGGSENEPGFKPKSECAKALVASGFKLANPYHLNINHEMKDDSCMIGKYQGEDYTAWRGQPHPLLPLYKNYVLEGSDIDNIKTGYDANHGNVLSFEVKKQSKNHPGLNPRDNLFEWTSHFARDKVLGTPNEQYTPSRGWRLAIVLNGQTINDPLLNQPLSDHTQVSGGFTPREVAKLARDLKAGSLSFTPEILSVENVSADLGYAERLQGIVATIIALVLVILLMVSYYRFSGVIASMAVLFNLLIMWGVLQNLGAALTLSGIAGIILTVGMAVDANVLVFERIREELKTTQNLTLAITTGYKKAFSAIFDSNITTIIAAIILLSFDSGPIKGLAITLTIGIASSMFTALFMTQTFFSFWLKKTKATTLSMASWFKAKTFPFLKHARWIIALSSLVILIGSTLLFLQKGSIMGMDFTGGYSLNLELEKSTLNPREKLSQALLKAGVKHSEMQIRELNEPHFLRLQLSSSLNSLSRPFYNMPLEQKDDKAIFAWQENPRLVWIASVIKNSDLNLTQKSWNSLDKSWSEISGQLSKTTRNNALWGLSIAILFILLYISMRYEIKYAISAILCLIHDVLITIASISILHFVGLPIQINMQIIAALMTIIGYSLNDTIIVFDRIREEKRLYRKLSFESVINRSIGITLNRTLMTSLTTFVVLLALVVFGGAKIFDFSLVMSLGVVLGTLSSLFIAPTFLSFFTYKNKVAKPSLNWHMSQDTVK